MDFNKAVIEKSYEQPVVVDFWAPWCGPCRILGPTIEQLAEEQSDRWTLVKLNTEEEYEVAERFRIRSIPNVKMFYQGEVVAEFAGALPRTAIEQWLEEHLPDDRKGELATLLEAVNNSDNGEALDKLVAFAEANADMPEATVAAARSLAFSDPEKARELVGDIHMGDKFYDEAQDIRQIAAFLTFKGDGQPVAQKLNEAREAFKNGDLETSIQRIIDATMIDKHYQDDLPRKTAIAFFRSLGEQHPLTKNYRRKFDMALY